MERGMPRMIEVEPDKFASLETVLEDDDKIAKALNTSTKKLEALAQAMVAVVRVMKGLGLGGDPSDMIAVVLAQALDGETSTTPYTVRLRLEARGLREAEGAGPGPGEGREEGR